MGWFECSLTEAWKRSFWVLHVFFISSRFGEVSVYELHSDGALTHAGRNALH
jgi:hypothetical protein